MEREKEIPCVNCHSYNVKEKKFSCHPSDCKELSMWLLKHAPQLKTETVQMQVQLPEIAIQYVV